MVILTWTTLKYEGCKTTTFQFYHSVFVVSSYYNGENVLLSACFYVSMYLPIIISLSPSLHLSSIYQFIIYLFIIFHQCGLTDFILIIGLYSITTLFILSLKLSHSWPTGDLMLWLLYLLGICPHPFLRYYPFIW